MNLAGKSPEVVEAAETASDSKKDADKDKKQVTAHEIHECIESVIRKFSESQWGETLPVQTVETIAKMFKDHTPLGSNTLY